MSTDTDRVAAGCVEAEGGGLLRAARQERGRYDRSGDRGRGRWTETHANLLMEVYDTSMPVFEFQCRDCERSFESFVTAERKPACPACGGANLLKQLSRLGMVGASASQNEASCAAPAAMCGARGGRCGCSS